MGPRTEKPNGDFFLEAAVKETPPGGVSSPSVDPPPGVGLLLSTLRCSQVAVWALGAEF